MPGKHVAQEEYELSRETTSESHEYLDDLDDADLESHPLTGGAHAASNRPARLSWNPLNLSSFRRRPASRKGRCPRRSRSCPCLRWPLFRRLILFSYYFFAAIVAITVLGGLFFPSYTNPPPHYKQLQRLAQAPGEQGRGNPRSQKIYIAASIVDRSGELARGAWGRNVLELISYLGPDNVYLSIYENDAGSEARDALAVFESQVPCNHTVIFEDHLSLESIPHVILPDGTERIRRVTYLAETRNRALRPLETTTVKFDKLLYLNDVFFNPIDVLQLLFSTNQDKYGNAQYRAVCAVDFVNAFKFYDTFATRDLEGYGAGVPFFPWFGSEGDAQSRRDVMQGKDAVRVRSCWGGMVAFDARFFQSSNLTTDGLETAANHSPLALPMPYRFRGEDEIFWDASECCLIHADIQNPEPGNRGIFMNPFVRVAYDTRTLSWLGFTRRFERLYSPIHFLIDILAGLPRYNPRRDQKPGQLVPQSTWVSDPSSPMGGAFELESRPATHDGFCGRRSLEVLKRNMTKGGRNWEFYPVPS